MNTEVASPRFWNMPTEEALGKRAQEILCAIVRSYIESGEALGSRTLSKLQNHALSPASIRNVMADLDDAGYLYQPHTSAGRIPTAKAFRFFIKSLPLRNMPGAESRRVVERFRDVHTVERRVERSCQVLTELTHNVGIAAALPANDQILDQVQLVALADRRVLMIVATDDRMVHNRVVNLTEAIPQESLNALRDYVNHNFAGWKILDARRELLRRIEEERAAYDAVLQRLTVLYRQGLLEVEQHPQIHMEGASNLFGLDLHFTKETMRDLFRALEEKQRILELLDRFLEQHGELQIHVGLGDVHPSMRELSLIGLTIPQPGGMLTRIAVLGPMRMNYARVIAAVREIGRANQQIPS